MANSFNIRPPEDVAFAYGFDKSKIAQAAMNKDLDETSAVLAAMWLDAGERHKAMQNGQQPTIAQQVFGGQPSSAPAPAPAGLGATPEAAAMPPMGPPPEMGAPPPPPQEMAPPQEMPSMAEGGMVPPYAAGGGLSELPIPDTMFDEPRNGGFDDGDGYAGGGMVAFSGGGPTGGFGDYIEEMVRKIDPNIRIAGRARTPAKNAQVGGVAGSYHLIDAARDISVPPGMSKPQFIAQLKSVFGADYDVLPSKGNSVHVEPGPKLGEKVRAGARPSGAPTIMPERNIGTAEGRGMSMQDSVGMAGRLLEDPEEYAQAKQEARARFEEMRSPEAYEKQRKSDMWQTLADIGFNMASSKAPNVLQAIGEAASAAMPGARADRKEREALKDRALDGLLKLGAADRAEAKEVLALGTDIYQTGLKQEQFEEELGLKREISEKELDLGERELNLRGLIAASKADGGGGGKKNTKEDFIETFYQQFIAKGYQPNLARQYAFIAAEKAMAKIKGTSAGLLFGDEEKTGGSRGGGASEEDAFEGFSATRN